MGTAEMPVIASLIARVLRAPGDDGVRTDVRGEVRELCRSFVPYPDLHA
jgi:glycine hydroxymethyltransferase